MKRTETGFKNVIIMAIIAVILFIGANALTTAINLVSDVQSQQNSFYTELEAELGIDY